MPDRLPRRPMLENYNWMVTDDRRHLVQATPHATKVTFSLLQPYRSNRQNPKMGVLKSGTILSLSNHCLKNVMCYHWSQHRALSGKLSCYSFR
jgi:hypothetical protein